ncbi:hypothetical protein BSK59_16000 [Paenibacillus odorifer]|uniref:hypothetical protein n=1 Tax=Paenibacillus odorifer TaxID=189426 RepID=UPI00096F6EA8|nr:hypothetical protein [Paenibacillus odorifer]OME54083.1 hypothetical protein BSK59_16000 [Paenibacillus odorifer]
MLELNKFPVISTESGEKYLITINRLYGLYCRENDIEVTIHLPYKTKFLKKEKFYNVNSFMYSAEEYRYDFIKMAKDSIKLHEKDLAERKMKAQKRAEGICRGTEIFNEWDGEC